MGSAGAGLARAWASEDFAREDLALFPAVEIVACRISSSVARALASSGVLKIDRRGKAAAERKQRLLGDAGEDEALLRSGQFEHALVGPVRVLAFEGQRQRRRRSRPTRPMRTGICIGFLSGWPGVGGTRLRQGERVGLGGGVVVAFGLDLRRAGLAVPEAELGKVAPAGILEAFDPILDRRGLAVMAREIKIGRLAVALRGRPASSACR